MSVVYTYVQYVRGKYFLLVQHSTIIMQFSGHQAFKLRKNVNTYSLHSHITMQLGSWQLYCMYSMYVHSYIPTCMYVHHWMCNNSCYVCITLKLSTSYKTQHSNVVSIYYTPIFFLNYHFKFYCTYVRTYMHIHMYVRI